MTNYAHTVANVLGVVIMFLLRLLSKAAASEFDDGHGWFIITWCGWWCAGSVMGEACEA